MPMAFSFSFRVGSGLLAHLQGEIALGSSEIEQFKAAVDSLFKAAKKAKAGKYSKACDEIIALAHSMYKAMGEWRIDV